MLEIAYAPPSDAQAVADFMHAAFPRAKWPMAGWQAITSGRWGAAGDPFAITVRDQGALVGVLGLITATRPTRGGMVKTMNMTSWYVSKSHRGQGVGSKMLALVTADPAVTVTNFSSARAAVPVVERAGFSVLDDKRLVWRHGGGSVFPVHHEPLALGDALPAHEVRILADHAGLDLKSVVVETPDGFCLLILSVKQKHDAYVTHEVIYVGDPVLFARYAREIADSLLPRDAAVLSVDRRFVAADVVPDAVEDIPVPRLYTAGAVPPADVDVLYSEIVLLGMKLY
jgi:GNAT superfamily N-acetyltransferase